MPGKRFIELESASGKWPTLFAAHNSTSLRKRGLVTTLLVAYALTNLWNLSTNIFVLKREEARWFTFHVQKLETIP